MVTVKLNEPTDPSMERIWRSEVDRQRAIQTDSVWSVIYQPSAANTRLRFCASTLLGALRFAADEIERRAA